MKTIEYYLMRHASYYDYENQYVSYHGFITLQHSANRLNTELEEKFPKKNLRIIHSVLPRAKHTALLIQEMIVGTKTFCSGDSRLNSDKLKIDEDYVKEVVGMCDKENEVCLLLSHQPDIEFFCKEKLETAQFVRKTVEFEEKPILEKDTDDDLPF